MWSYQLDQVWASLIGNRGQFSRWKGLIHPTCCLDLKFYCTVNSWNMAIWNWGHFLHRWIYTNLCIYGVVKAEETRYQHRTWTSIALLEPTAQILLLFACSLICVFAFALYMSISQSLQFTTTLASTDNNGPIEDYPAHLKQSIKHSVISDTSVILTFRIRIGWINSFDVFFCQTEFLNCKYAVFVAPGVSAGSYYWTLVKSPTKYSSFRRI